MNKSFDCNGLLGEWPFRRFYHGGMEGLRRVWDQAGIGAGAVSTLRSVFYNDPMEAEELLAEALKGTGCLHILGVNPALPAAALSVDEAVERFGIRGVRLYPGYHGYRLDDPCMDRLYAVLRKHRLPLVVSLRLEDERLNYLVKPRTLTTEELTALPDRMPGVKILYTGIQAYEATGMAAAFREKENLYLETSWFKSAVHPFEDVTAVIPAEKVLYGSGYPLNCLQSTMTALDHSTISEEAKAMILRENAARFFLK